MSKEYLTILARDKADNTRTYAKLDSAIDKFLEWASLLALIKKQ